MSKQPKPPFPRQHQRKPGLESTLKPRPRFKASHYKGSGKLAGKVAIISGADSGIGRAVAVLFAREGANIVGTYLPAEKSDAHETTKNITREGGEGVFLSGDITSPEFAKKVVEKAIKIFKRIDIVVNNAAYQQHHKSILDITDDEWDRTFKTNIYGYFYLAKAALPHLKPGSTIINTGSITGLEGSEKLIDYASTKGAIHAFTKSLALQLLPRGIRVNAVSPGPVWTPLNPSDRPPKEVAKFGANTPMGRPAQPEEIAPAYVYFASNTDSSYITGEVLTLLGGKTTAT